jgi:hypothetical protein
VDHVVDAEPDDAAHGLCVEEHDDPGDTQTRAAGPLLLRCRCRVGGIDWPLLASREMAGWFVLTLAKVRCPKRAFPLLLSTDEYTAGQDPQVPTPTCRACTVLVCLRVSVQLRERRTGGTGSRRLLRRRGSRGE